jgi:hypothetical protein
MLQTLISVRKFIYLCIYDFFKDTLVADTVGPKHLMIGSLVYDYFGKKRL